MFKQNVFFHGHHAMLLIIRNQTFLVFGDTTRTIGLQNIMTNSTLHGLSQTSFSLLPSLIMKKCQGKNNLQQKIHAFKFKVN
jgi:hypothetical protein